MDGFPTPCQRSPSAESALAPDRFPTLRGFVFVGFFFRRFDCALERAKGLHSPYVFESVEELPDALRRRRKLRRFGGILHQLPKRPVVSTTLSPSLGGKSKHSLKMNDVGASESFPGRFKI